MCCLQLWFTSFCLDAKWHKHCLLTIPPLFAVLPVCGLQQKNQHINLTELQAFLMVLQHFKPLIQDKHMLMRTDSSYMLAYINRLGGVRSASLLQLSERSDASAVPMGSFMWPFEEHQVFRLEGQCFV